MSSHNIGFYEEMKKIIFQLSSHNIGFYIEMKKIIFQISSNTHLIFCLGF